MSSAMGFLGGSGLSGAQDPGKNGGASAGSTSGGVSEEDQSQFDRLIAQYGAQAVPVTTLFFIISTLLVKVATYALVTAMKQASDNAKIADRLNHLVAKINALKAKQGKAVAGAAIPPSPELDALKAQLEKNGYTTPCVTWADLDGLASLVKADCDAKSQQGTTFQMAIQQNSSRLENVSAFGSNGMSKGWSALQTVVNNMAR